MSNIPAPPDPTDADLDEALAGLAVRVPVPDTGFPTARLVAFLGPHIAWLAGAAASWLLVHVHFLGLFHIQHDGLSTAIAQGLTFALVTAVTYAGQHKWLEGNKAWEQGLLQLAAKAIEPPAPAQLPAPVIVTTPAQNPTVIYKTPSVGPSVYTPEGPQAGIYPPVGGQPAQTPTESGHPDGDDYDSAAEQAALDAIDIEAGLHTEDSDLPISPDIDR